MSKHREPYVDPISQQDAQDQDPRDPQDKQPSFVAKKRTSSSTTTKPSLPQRPAKIPRTGTVVSCAKEEEAAQQQCDAAAAADFAVVPSVAAEEEEEEEEGKLVVAAKQQPPAAPLVQEIKLSPYIIYPAKYNTFDPQRIVFAKDSIKAKTGGGFIIFMQYVHDVTDPATGKSIGVTKQFLWNTPNGMHLPSGVKLWEVGNPSVLASCGENWDKNELMVTQANAFELIRQRCIDVVLEKGLAGPTATRESVAQNFAPPMFVGVDAKTGKQYPPSIKLSVITGKDASEFFEYAPSPPLKPLLPIQITPGSQATIVAHIAWLHYGKKMGAMHFNLRLNVFQLVAQTPSAFSGVVPPSSDGSSSSVCTVQF
jgi:hypothetical protein